MKVWEIMTTDPYCCTSSDTVESAAWIMREKDVGSLPIVRDQHSRRLQGIVTDRDLCCAMLVDGKHPKTTLVGEVMTPHPVTCEPGDDLEICVRIMQEHQVRRVPVVDHEGCCIGVVAQADLALRAKPQHVYETVAEISKRWDAKRPVSMHLLCDE